MIALSSAYDKHVILGLTLGKSLMYMRNKIGPRMEPWRTPIVIGLKLECSLFIATHCILPVKYEETTDLRDQVNEALRAA